MERQCLRPVADRQPHEIRLRAGHRQADGRQPVAHAAALLDGGCHPRPDHPLLTEHGQGRRKRGGGADLPLFDVLFGFVGLPIACVAAVDGAALGAGMQLAAACDLRIATPDSRFGIPAAKLGLAVDHWTVERLAREAGWSVARNMLLTASIYDAAGLVGPGFVHRLGGLDDALAWADEIAELAPLTVAAHKIALERSAPPPEPDELVAAARERAWESEDQREGREAFFERRPPRFTGH